ncbi:hypothetical protein M8A51_25750 [Schlegelella sp. S2-27]|uniref:Uncharacterized protein n=1 Tax=Caldimonas mangrovi TaxID=2944811 RepID=A0ABT0YW27_9BURK|nr:hypothetical protein [Caldimonas mangrovi]MCM5682942.1 hypothetical protein [Caldimonas mangrovi]
MANEAKALPVVAYMWMFRDSVWDISSMKGRYQPMDEYHTEHPLVRQSDAESALAEMRAEVEKYKAIATGVRSYLTDALAMALAEEDGHEGDDKHRPIWSGGAAPEPEGEVWQRYHGKAGTIAEKAIASVADWSAAEDAYHAELRDECIEQARIEKQRADTAEARLERAERHLKRLVFEGLNNHGQLIPSHALRVQLEQAAAFLGEGK